VHILFSAWDKEFALLDKSGNGVIESKDFLVKVDSDETENAKASLDEMLKNIRKFKAADESKYM
jgi:Ca2+-binding EF-hand superfamily protein